MKQGLNLTFKNLDYNFQVIKFPTVSASCVEVQVLLNHVTRTLVKSTATWRLKGSETSDDQELIDAIGQIIDQRYRLS